MFLGYIYTAIFIGFQLPDTTYPEVEQIHDVTLIKGAGNVTEQTIIVAVTLYERVPPGSGFDVATPSRRGLVDGTISDNDLNFGQDFSLSLLVSFQPNQSEIFIPFTIFHDIQVENIEAVQLIIEAPTAAIELHDSPPRFKTLSDYSSFFIVIEDDDRKLLCVVACFNIMHAFLACIHVAHARFPSFLTGYRIGFENSSYTVNEGVGSLEVCVRMFEPPDDIPIDGNFIVAVETVADTAGE